MYTSLRIGTVLRKKYRIDKVIAQGGFGITYLATDMLLEHKLVIKEFFMKGNCNRDNDTQNVEISTGGFTTQFMTFKSKFVKEARILYNFRGSEGVVQVYDVFEENGTAYYTMDFIDGTSLEYYINECGKLNEKEALDIIRKIAAALSEVHNKKYLHLDLSPRNIMITPQKKIVLIDFGVSKHYNESSSEQTTETPLAYSRGYAPLEQYNQDVKVFRPATDIYSLGAVLFFMLTGKRPADASSVYEDGCVDGIPHNISSDTKYVIEKAMQPSSKNRPQTIDEFLALINGRIIRKREKEEVVVAENEKEGNSILTNIIIGIVVIAVVYFLFADIFVSCSDGLRRFLEL